MHDKERYDMERYDKEQYDKERYDKERYDKEQYDKERYDKLQKSKDTGTCHGFHVSLVLIGIAVFTVIRVFAAG